jgi:hypothetical protein
MSDGSEEAGVVGPLDPFESGELDISDGTPRTLLSDDLRLEEADDGPGQGVVVAVAPAADGGLNTGLGQAMGVANAQISNAAIGVVNERFSSGLLASTDGLLERIE